VDVLINSLMTAIRGLICCDK